MNLTERHYFKSEFYLLVGLFNFQLKTNNMENSRKWFFKQAGTGLLTLGLSSAMLPGSLLAMDNKMAPKETALFKVGIAYWTFVKFKLEPALEMTERVNVKYICIKDFHLPVNSTSGQIAEFHAKLKAKGITGYGVGPLRMHSEAEVDNIFEYAKNVGVKLIVAVPDPELLPYVEKNVKKYDFRIAIHNHGIEEGRYPSVESIYEKIKNLDVRIGICHDIGYSAQMGFDPARLTLKYGHRVYEMHIKDMTSNTNDAKDCEIGRGVIDFPALVKALEKTRYKDHCSIEMEKDASDPLPGLAESVGFFRGVMGSV